MGFIRQSKHFRANYGMNEERPVDQASRLLDKMIDLKQQVGHVIDTKPAYKTGPYPLDPYLKASISEVLSQPVHVDAPVYNNYGDVKKVLNTVNKKINQLESNLRHVTRVRQTEEIACLAKVLAQEGDDVQQSKIKSMVDRYIRSQKKVIEGEVKKKLLDAEQKQTVDVTTKDVDKKKPSNIRGPPSFALRKKEKTANVNGKENKPVIYRPVERNLQLNNRARVPAPTHQAARLQKPTLKPRVTETRRRSPPRINAAPANNVIPMAVPLCNPRFRPGRTQYGVLSCQPVASSSPSNRQLSTSVHNNISQLAETTITELNHRVPSPAGGDDMSEITEGNYDSMIHNDLYDEDQFGTGIALPGYQREAPVAIQKPRSPPAKIAAKPPTLESYAHYPSSDVIATDMHRQNVLENKAFEWLQCELMGLVMSKVSADPGVRRETSLYEDHQYRYTHLEEPQNAGELTDDEESRLSQESEATNPSLPDESNQNLKQVFIDAGQPVNDQLVATLVHEALRERVLSLLGQTHDNQAVGGDENNMLQESKQVPGVVRDDYEDDDFEPDSPELSAKQIRTPDLTPVSSPRYSPVRKTSPTPEVQQTSPVRKEVTRVSLDNSAVYNSLLPIDVEPVRQPSPYSDSEPSTSYDISKELRRLASKPNEESSDFVTDIHDVHTPTITPPPHVSPSPPQSPLLTLPNFTSSPPPVQSLRFRSPAATMTDRGELDRGQATLGATGMSLYLNRTQTSIDDNSQRDFQDGTTVGNMESSNMNRSLEESQKSMRPLVPERSLRSPIRTTTIDRQQFSPVVSPEPKSISTSYTETINECVSEGQWLLNRSEGQIADIPLDPGVLQNGRFNQIDLSTASTLKDTDDLELDDMEVLKSEGEFMHYSSVPIERNMARILEIQEESLKREVENYPSKYNINTYPGTEQTQHAEDYSYDRVSNAKVIQVGKGTYNSSGQVMSSLESPRLESRQVVRRSLQDYEDTPDSTMNLDELDNSKVNQGRKYPIQVKPRTTGTGTTFSFSEGSLRNSQFEQSTSDVESSHYKMHMSVESENSYEYEEELELKPREGFGSGTYRMSVTVPSVEPVLEDDDSEEISEIDATNEN